MKEGITLLLYNSKIDIQTKGNISEYLKACMEINREYKMIIREISENPVTKDYYDKACLECLKRDEFTEWAAIHRMFDLMQQDKKNTK